MNHAILIEETIDTPRVEMDKEKGLFKISGRSLPEDAVLFYAPVRDWLFAYMDDPNPQTEFIFEMDYYNSASAKQFILTLSALEKITESGRRLNVIWFYNKEDEIMQDRGEELRTMTSVPFELRHY